MWSICSRPSWWKTIVSSTRFRNSGLKCARSASSTRALDLVVLVSLELDDVLAADVRGHDQDGVAEVDRPPLAVGQPAVVEDLEQHVEDVRVRLLDLVEEHDAVGAAAHGLGELAALLVADVAGRRADQPRRPSASP